jgi:hypothetical protein
MVTQPDEQTIASRQKSRNWFSYVSKAIANVQQQQVSWTGFLTVHEQTTDITRQTGQASETLASKRYAS